MTDAFKPRVIGVDFSVEAIDIVALPWDGEDLIRSSWRRIELPDKRTRGRGGIAACLRMRELVITAVDWGESRLIYVEDPMSVSIGTAKTLGRVGGAFIASLPYITRANAQVNVIDPQEWKRVLTGDAKAGKDKVRRYVEALGFLRLGAGQDAFDAAGIAWAARQENRAAISYARGAT